MARNGDLPRGLAEVHERYQVPHVAEITLGVVVSLLVLAVDLRGVIGFSSFGVLVYYFVANLAALRQRDGRMFPRWLQVLGLVLCGLLVVTLPWPSVVLGVLVYVVGVVGRLVALRRRSA